jgi:hypothetical protein
MRVLPGDEIVTNPAVNQTRAITINAPVDQVWGWIAQIGQNRGGLYINEWLEQLFGGATPNAERIMPEFQKLEVGDYVLLYPNGPGYAAATIQAPRVLVLRTVNFDTGEFTSSVEHDGVHGTLTFFLEPRVDNTTRLYVRTRTAYAPGRLSAAVWGMVEPVNFVMERQLLRGVKTRAEAHRVPNELLDQVMPEYEFRDVESILIHASPEQIFEAFSEVREQDMPLAQVLGQVRFLPIRLSGHTSEHIGPDEPLSHLMLKMGFIGLGEDPGLQVVLGAIGKFHELTDQRFVHVRDADEFRRFLHEDYQKLAISLRVTGDDPVMGCTLTLEHRTHAMSEHARKQFARYWLAIKPGGGFVTHQLLGAVKHRAEAIAKPPKAARSQLSAAPPSLVTPVPNAAPPTEKPEPVVG